MKEIKRKAEIEKYRGESKAERGGGEGDM